MNALRSDLQTLAAKHIPLPRLLRLLADELHDGAPETSIRQAPHYTQLLDDGTPRLDPQDGDHVATYDASTGLIWAAAPLTCGEVPWAQAIEEAKKLRLFGATDWRLPTIRELLSIVDYDRFDPAVDTDAFKGSYGWTWSSTPAKSPSGCAWRVGLNGGASSRFHQALHFQVRAVRAGQPLALGL